MNGREVETSRITSGTKHKLQDMLRGRWNRLHWGLDVDTPQGKMKGVLIEQVPDGSRSTIIAPEGNILDITAEGAQEVDLQGYLNLLSVTERVLEEIKQAQHKEMMTDPEGRNVLWRPSAWLLSKWYCDTKSSDRPKTLWVKQGVMYCPHHPDKPLVSMCIPGQGERHHLTVCSEDDCSFDVYNGT